MVKIPKEVIIEKIKNKTNLSDAEISARIKKKLDQLSGLISEEGAAHIIANELGVKIFEESGKLLIKDIFPGMKNIEVVGKVVRVFDVRTFEKDSRKGKIGSFILGDETGVVRVVAWNDKADVLDKISPDAVIRIQDGYVRENQRGLKEIHLGDRAQVTLNPKGVADVKLKGNARKTISDLKENEENVELLGTVVQVFDPRFFEICPECGKRVREKEDSFFCEAHGKVSPSYSYVLNLFLDDGTDNIRVVLWRNQMQRILNKSHEEIVLMKDKSFEDVKTELLGKIVKFVGRTSKNEMFERIEFIPQLVILNPDPKQEMARLEKVPESKPQPPEPKQEESEEPESDDIEILSLDDLESL